MAGWIWRLYHATGGGRLFNYLVHLSRHPGPNSLAGRSARSLPPTPSRNDCGARRSVHVAGGACTPELTKQIADREAFPARAGPAIRRAFFGQVCFNKPPSIRFGSHARAGAGGEIPQGRAPKLESGDRDDAPTPRPLEAPGELRAESNPVKWCAICGLEHPPHATVCDCGTAI